MDGIILEVRNLTKTFPSKKGGFNAVDDISLSIKDGEILGLLGPNGAGKTTTIQMLLGVMDPSDGDILYFGTSLQKNRETILKQINFSSTYISLPWWFTVSEILELFARLYEIQERQKRIKKLLREFEMEELYKKEFRMLSAGEKTRLLLAKAFLNYPKIILLDEPTASLDPDIAVRIRQFLKKEKEKYNVSMLFTSHNMDEVEEMCDRVIVLSHGKIIAKDTPVNLVKSIRESEIELLIKKDRERAMKLFNKLELPFTQNGTMFTLVVDEKTIAEFLTLLTKENIEYEDISINKPDLEDYFLNIAKGEST